MNQPENLTVGELRKYLAQLVDNPEINPDALSIEEAQAFKIEDPLTHEFFGGYSLVEKAEKMKAEGPTEKVMIIRNLY